MEAVLFLDNKGGGSARSAMWVDDDAAARLIDPSHLIPQCRCFGGGVELSAVCVVRVRHTPHFTFVFALAFNEGKSFIHDITIKLLNYSNSCVGLEMWVHGVCGRKLLSLSLPTIDTGTIRVCP